jgi:cyclophilin family peptidyl-prolyl cis-trans isomerase
MRLVLLFAAVIAVFSSSRPMPLDAQTPAPTTAPVIVLTTSKGVIEIETFPAEAPKSVARVVELAKGGFYRGTRVHWVQPGIIQFGDQLSRDMTKRDKWGTGGSGLKQAVRPIGVTEFTKRRFETGIVGLAYRNGDKPQQADCQIFILKAPNPALNGKYAAIGRVAKGMDVVNKIELVDLIKDVAVR